MTKTKTHQIPADVLDVLTRSRITESALTLPQQLTPQLYKATMKIIAAAGGRWDRKAACHLFDKDPRAAMGMAIEAGEILDEKKTFQAFYTPQEVAREMAALIVDQVWPRRGGLGGQPDFEKVPRILEPSAGNGALADAAYRLSARVVCIEIRPDAAEEMRKRHPRTVTGDFLTKTPGPNLFDGVLMNPPFTGDQDAAHVLHAWNFVRPGGSLAAIVSPRFNFATTPRAQALAALINRYSRETRELPAGTFRESGTNVSTFLTILDK